MIIGPFSRKLARLVYGCTSVSTSRVARLLSGGMRRLCRCCGTSEPGRSPEFVARHNAGLRPYLNYGRFVSNGLTSPVPWSPQPDADAADAPLPKAAVAAPAPHRHFVAPSRPLGGRRLPPLPAARGRPIRKACSRCAVRRDRDEYAPHGRR